MTITLGQILDRNAVIQYVGANAAKYNIDPAAVLAVAAHEGLNTTPGSSWTVPGERNISFGPPSWFGNGAGATLLQQFGSQAPAWSWTPAGIDYWLKSVANAGAAGLSGTSAIRAIVTGFERPKESLVPGEISNAEKDYQSFQAAIGGQVALPDNGGTTQSPIPTPAQVQIPPGGVTTSPSTQTQVLAGINAGSFGPFPINLPSGLILALIGIVLLIMGSMLFGFNVQNKVNSSPLVQLAAEGA